MVYYQHDIRATERLTLNLGLRWELHSPFQDKTMGGSVFDFNAPGGRVLYRDKAYTELVSNPILAACCASDTLINTDWKDFAPRIGLAWLCVNWKLKRGSRRKTPASAAVTANFGQ